MTATYDRSAKNTRILQPQATPKRPGRFCVRARVCLILCGMRVMGIDPGLRTTGYGLVELVGQTIEPTLCEAGVIRVDAKQPLEQRLGQLHKELDVLVEQVRKDWRLVST